jgi:hypothetical protein
MPGIELPYEPGTVRFSDLTVHASPPFPGDPPTPIYVGIRRQHARKAGRSSEDAEKATQSPVTHKDADHQKDNEQAIDKPRAWYTFHSSGTPQNKMTT